MDMNAKGNMMQPAMTPEEWRASTVSRQDGDVTFKDDKAPEGGDNLLLTDREDGGEIVVFQKDRHALAALALYGQPFGFTHDDVALLKWILEEVPEIATWVTRHNEWGDHALTSIADRIAALLPPADKITVTDFSGTREI